MIPFLDWILHSFKNQFHLAFRSIRRVMARASHCRCTMFRARDLGSVIAKKGWDWFQVNSLLTFHRPSCREKGAELTGVGFFGATLYNLVMGGFRLRCRVDGWLASRTKIYDGMCSNVSCSLRYKVVIRAHPCGETHDAWVLLLNRFISWLALKSYWPSGYSLWSQCAFYGRRQRA